MTARRRRTACSTCRQRKIQCSSERPECRTCINSRRNCGGYGIMPPRQHDHDPALAAAAARREPQNCLLVSINALHQERQQLFSLYLGHQFPDEVTTLRNRERNWVMYVPDMTRLDPSLEAAILATCSGRLANRDGNEAMAYKSMAYYNKSLQELRKAIGNPTLRYQEQTMATCLALTMYEWSECPEGQVSGYYSHYQGAMTLLQHRGASSHTSGLAHSVLRALRMHTVFNSYESRSTNFLADRDWLDLPFSQQKKDSHDQLVDIMLKLPRILPKPESKDSNPSRQDYLCATLRRVRQCWRLDSELNEWLEQLASKTSGPLYWAETTGELLNMTKSASEDINDLFPVAYTFPTFILAQTMLLYWLARVVVCYQLGQLYEKLETFTKVKGTRPIEEEQCLCPEKCQDKKPTRLTACLVHFTTSQLPQLGYRRDWSQAVARHICQSFAYFLQARMRCSGPSCLIPALRVLRWHWEVDSATVDRSREKRWVNNILALISARGTRIASQA